MIFRYVILCVADVPATLAFYRAAFGLPEGFLHESGDYGEVRTGETKLAFSSIRLMRALGKDVAATPPARPSFEIAFETDDVPAALARALSAGADLVQDVARMDWGQTIAYVRAPEGTLVEICTAVAPPG